MHTVQVVDDTTFRICVITWVTSEDYADVAVFVNAIGTSYVDPHDHDLDGMRGVCRSPLGQTKSPEFRVGEILVVDGYGREVGGRRRKPSKWCVSFEEFRLGQLDTAIRLAEEVTHQYTTTPTPTETLQITLGEKDLLEEGEEGMRNDNLHLEMIAEDVVMLATILSKLGRSNMLRGYSKSILSQEERDW